MIPLTGWAPDADPTTPGILRSGSFTLSKRGIAPALQFTQYGVDAPNFVYRFDYVASTRAMAGATSGSGSFIYRFTPAGSGNWANISRTPAYPLSSSFRFARFGDYYLAASVSTPLQWVLAPPSVGDVYGPMQDALNTPQGALIVSMPNFVLMFGTTDIGGANFVSDRWWCSPINNPLNNWTPSVTTQANNGRLIGNGGAITAALPLGDRVVVYKQTSIFVGTYVGSPEVWRWEQVPGEIGTRSAEGVVDVGGAHFIVGTDNIWLFDGTRPVALGRGVSRDTMFDRLALSPGYGTRPVTVYDKVARQVFFKLHDSTTDLYSYDIETQRFGVQQLSPTPVVIPFRETGFGQFDSAVIGAIQVGARVGRLLRTGSISFTTGAYGADSGPSQVRNVRIVCTRPALIGATLTGAAGLEQGTATPTGSAATSSVTGGTIKFDIRQTGRWHQFSAALAADMTGNLTNRFEATHIDMDIRPLGTR